MARSIFSYIGGFVTWLIRNLESCRTHTKICTRCKASKANVLLPGPDGSHESAAPEGIRSSQTWISVWLPMLVVSVTKVTVHNERYVL